MANYGKRHQAQLAQDIGRCAMVNTFLRGRVRLLLCAAVQDVADMTILTKEQRSEIDARQRDSVDQHMGEFAVDEVDPEIIPLLMNSYNECRADRGALLASEQALREQVEKLKTELKALQVPIELDYFNWSKTNEQVYLEIQICMAH